MFSQIARFVVEFLIICVFYIVGFRDGRNEMADAVQAPGLHQSSVDAINSGLLDDYLNGELPETIANEMFLVTDLKTVTIPMNIKKWGAIEVGEYDPSQDPHAGKNSPYGTGSCVLPSGDGSFGCGEDEKSNFRCTIYVKVEKGPMAGTTFYSKSCDGKPIAERKGNKLVIHYQTILHRK